MARPHIEFIATQVLPWEAMPGDARADCQAKVLSLDPERGDCSLIVRYPPGWRRPAEALAADEELFVLDGELTVGDYRYQPHGYGFFPAGYGRGAAASAGGAVAVTFFSAWPNRGPVTPAKTPAIEHLDAVRLEWDTADIDPGLAFMGIRRKTLRVNPEHGQRASFLIATSPHNHPKDWKCPTLTHPCVEECFMLAGDLTGPQGVLHTGAYFWRPAGIPHGPFGSLNGSLSLIRFVYGRHVNVWGKEDLPYTFFPEHRPVLPPHLAALGREPYRGTAPY
jgi:hypothetical protein